MSDPPGASAADDHVARNRAAWTAISDAYAERAPTQWARAEISWGIWDVAEREVDVLGDTAGLDVLELGCGTAYFSAWLARRGARPVGVDVTPRQLQTAREMQRRFGIQFPLLEASAEELPLADESFDLALSEYGASIWCDPYRWIAEAARVLRPGGRLVFLRNSTVSILATPEEGPAQDRLLRDYFGLGRIEWADDGSVEFHLGYGDWIRLLRRCGLDLLDLVELRAPANATTRFEHVTAEWARRWPAEEIWVARKRG